MTNLSRARIRPVNTKKGKVEVGDAFMLHGKPYTVYTIRPSEGELTLLPIGECATHFLEVEDFQSFTKYAKHFQETDFKFGMKVIYASKAKRRYGDLVAHFVEFIDNSNRIIIENAARLVMEGMPSFTVPISDIRPYYPNADLGIPMRNQIPPYTLQVEGPVQIGDVYVYNNKFVRITSVNKMTIAYTDQDGYNALTHYSGFKELARHPEIQNFTGKNYRIKYKEKVGTIVEHKNRESGVMVKLKMETGPARWVSLRNVHPRFPLMA